METAGRVILLTKWKVHKVFHIFLLDSVVQWRQDMNFETVLDTADPIEPDNEYHVEEIIGSLEKNSKVTYLEHR
jgi:hypothetical protein